MIRSLRKLFYYRDMNLIVRIIYNIALVSVTSQEKRLRLVPETVSASAVFNEEKVRKYVTFFYFIMKRLWIRPSCFNNSVSVCRIFRTYGINARIVFGCVFENKTLKGHCWIETGGKVDPGKYVPVFCYSGERSFF